MKNGIRRALEKPKAMRLKGSLEFKRPARGQRSLFLQALTSPHHPQRVLLPAIITGQTAGVLIAKPSVKTLRGSIADADFQDNRIDSDIRQFTMDFIHQHCADPLAASLRDDIQRNDMRLFARCDSGQDKSNYHSGLFGHPCYAFRAMEVKKQLVAGKCYMRRETQAVDPVQFIKILRFETA